jgi:hypothetical protein
LIVLFVDFYPGPCASCLLSLLEDSHCQGNSSFSSFSSSNVGRNFISVGTSYLQCLVGHTLSRFPKTYVTGFRIRFREWVGRLLGEQRVAGISSGFMFRKKDGKLAKAAYFEDPTIARL